MNTSDNIPVVYTIPAGAPFSKTLAQHIWNEAQQNDLHLSDIRVLLPTRRACRTLREAFLQLSEGKPLLLPRMQSFGDIDEEELSFALAGADNMPEFLDLPPGLSPLRRRLLLAKAIEKIPQFKAGSAQAVALADALGHFIDQIYTEGLSMDNLADLVPENFATHWQITLDFLKILSEHWPNILAEHNAIDMADRRVRLIQILTDIWKNNPPQHPIIAAGSTGSIPATADLLSVISRLPQGKIILPGLDQNMDQTSWDQVTQTHPQYGLKHLLHHIGTDRIAVKALTLKIESQNRAFVANEIMRPASTSQSWRNLNQRSDEMNHALDGITLYECDHQQEEATVISSIMRETLETPEQSCTLITPDRQLARRVSIACARWGITVDDSGGEKLSHHNIGTFLSLSLDAVLNEFSPVALLALLKHPFSRASMEAQDYLTALEELETSTLRGLKPASGITGVRARFDDDIPQNIETLLFALEDASGAFTNAQNTEQPFQTLLTTHLKMCETLATTPEKLGNERLWQGDAGEEAASFLHDLQAEASIIGAVSLHNYAAILQTLLSSITIRPRYGTHPRLHILGQLEARLNDADILIMAGLNEGSWPADTGHDPWMSRPMRDDFGLPGLERAVGLAAHDFVQGFCSKKVFLTRAKRIDGAPSVPSRWLQRLSTVLQAAQLSIDTIKTGPHLNWARMMDKQGGVLPLQRPAPTPPANARPTRLPVTKIETWLKDPYGIYARYVLGLKALEPIEKEPGAAERGNVLHDVLERFVKTHPRDLPNNSKNILTSYAQEALGAYHDDPAIWRFWWPRFDRLCDWYIAHEENWRKTAHVLGTEIEGKMDIAGLTLSSKADRIDSLQEGGAALIDYKSAGTYSKTAIKTGTQPQLALEALILKHGGFEGVGVQDTSYLGYWRLSGARPAGQEIALYDGFENIIEQTREGLETLIHEFQNPDTPYYALPDLENAPRFNDYELLARVKEWAALDDQDQEAA